MENPFDDISQRLENLERGMLKLIEMVDNVIAVKKEPVMEEDIEYDMKGLGKYLKCASSTIQRYKNNKVFPYYQVGRTVKFKKSEVDKAMHFKTIKRRE